MVLYWLMGGQTKQVLTLPRARLTKWSPAAGRTVKRSGLRDTGGIYLVSVYRAISGNIHRAVGQGALQTVMKCERRFTQTFIGKSLL